MTVLLSDVIHGFLHIQVSEWKVVSEQQRSVIPFFLFLNVLFPYKEQNVKYLFGLLKIDPEKGKRKHFPAKRCSLVMFCRELSVADDSGEELTFKVCYQTQL